MIGFDYMGGADARAREMKAKLINVDIRRGETGLFVATSPDLPGLYLAENSEEAVTERLKGAIEFLFELEGIKVEAIETESRTDAIIPPWVAIPQNGSLASRT